MDRIAYKDGYKYQLQADYTVQTAIVPMVGDIFADYLTLSDSGSLLVRKGYAWDGPSGPAFDTPNFMRGSLVHDAFYQLMREGYIPWSCRESADKLLISLCEQDGMGWLRRQWVYLGVRVGGNPGDHPLPKPVLFAP